jgi:DNA-binding MarR family transcriptional regulator
VWLDQPALRALRILTEVAERRNVTQRALSKTLDIALGLTNLYLKRLVRKGYIKVSTIPPNRLTYLLTPKGIAEKTRLTYEYMEYSLRLYRQTRAHLRAGLQPLAARGARRIVLCGTGEAAELAYLTMTELGLTVAGIMDTEPRTDTFLGLPVLTVSEALARGVDAVVVATFTPQESIVQTLVEQGVERDKIVLLRRG